MATVLVNLKSSGHGDIVKDKPVIQSIVAYYQNGMVKTQSGDTWKVKKSPNGLADYVTVG